MMIGSKNVPIRTTLIVVIVIYVVVEVFFYMYQSSTRFKTDIKENFSTIGCQYVDKKYNSIQNTDSVIGKTRVFFIFGTRPEVIKMAPVIQEFDKSTHFDVVKVFSGQHPDMIKPFLELFDIKVDIYITNTMIEGQTLSNLIANVIKSMELCIKFKPTDIWMVQGDTSTAFAVGAVAFNNKLRIGHIEAGLRTYNMYSPFPEEFNRRTLTSIATYHFAPTVKSKNNLIAEGVPLNKIYLTGNTVIDAVRILNEKLPPELPKMFDGRITDEHEVILVTMHRRENVKVMPYFYDAMGSVSCPFCRFVVPVHPNPNAGRPARNICRKEPVRFICVPPLGYQDLHLVMRRSQFILTDSGGLQEEATWYHKPIVVLREDTERTEAIDAGVAVLIGRNYNKLKSLIVQLLNKSSDTSKEMSKIIYPFGYGNASQQILSVLVSKENENVDSVLSKPSVNSTKTEVVIQKPDDSNLEVISVDKSSPSVAVILQVYKRKTLALQLKHVKQQTLKPKTIVIFQNGFHVDVGNDIKAFRMENPDIEIQHVATSKNARYHGRFHVAYMTSEDYVSIWDDDVLPGNDWIRYCIEYSQTHANALVGANGRSFAKFNGSIMFQREFVGRNDFVGHTWTLLRRLLKYYIDLKPFTHHTGEDIQLAFALQKIGIESHTPKQQGDKNVVDYRRVNADNNAGFLQNKAPRQLLFCEILQAGFQPMKCSNCDDPKVIDTCINLYQNEAAQIEKEAQMDDAKENNDVIWTSFTNSSRTSG